MNITVGTTEELLIACEVAGPKDWICLLPGRYELAAPIFDRRILAPVIDPDQPAAHIVSPVDLSPN